MIDRGYYEDFHGIKAHYQCDVQKESSQQYKKWASTINYNFHGANSRVNVDSIDNSSNVVNIGQENVFDGLRATLKEHISSEQELKGIIERVDEMEKAKGSPSFTNKYKDFVETVANHMSVVSPIIPALTQLFI